jgi:hypothetical protein
VRWLSDWLGTLDDNYGWLEIDNVFFNLSNHSLLFANNLVRKHARMPTDKVTDWKIHFFHFIAVWQQWSLISVVCSIDSN